MRTVKFNRIRVGEISVNYLNTPGAASMEAKAAFVSSTEGATHGWTTCTQWSRPVLEKLEELRALMESELERIHFADGSDTADGTSGPSIPKGLGESLGSVPQV